jgi:hypothetical protein
MIATKGWEMKLEIDLSGLGAADIVSPSMIVVVVGNDRGIANLTTQIEFFGIVSPMF